MSKRDPGAITEYNIVQWFRWADSDESEIVKGMRADRVQRYLFPDDIGDEEQERRERAVERARRRAGDGDGEQFGGWPEPFPPPGEQEIVPPPSSPPKYVHDDVEEWDGLIPRHSAAYRRASTHDGTQARVDEMRMRAQGSPFFADDPPPPPAPKRTPAQEDALAKRAREMARRARR